MKYYSTPTKKARVLINKIYNIVLYVNYTEIKKLSKNFLKHRL